MASDALESLRQTFFEECEEQLADLEAGLLQMEEGATDKETVNAVFRAVHSVKGGAGAFKLENLVTFAHIFETALDEIRADTLEPTPPLMKAMLRASDVLADLVEAAREGEELDESRWRGLADEIAGFCGGGQAPKAPAPDAGPAPVNDDKGGVFDDEPTAPAKPSINDEMGGVFEDEPGKPNINDAAGGVFEDEPDSAFTPQPVTLPGVGGAPAAAVEDPPVPHGGKIFNVLFRPKTELYEKANDAVVLLREIERLGEMRVVCDVAQVPLLDQLDPMGACLAFDIRLSTESDEQAVRDVFEFCEEDCELAIEPVVGAAEARPADAPPPSVPAPSADDDAPKATPAEAEVLKALRPDEPAADAPPPPAPKPAKKAEAAEKPRAQAAPQSATIRVDLDRVDRLINLVGELVINQAMLAQAVHGVDGANKDPNVASGLDELDQLTREIQESVMAIRAQPLKPLFQRMGRIVREVADATGKKVKLVTEGEWTEVDKTVVERLADPLTHMIRNAIDHGLEKPEKRLELGKPEEGIVKLAAAHRSGRVVITISDDGAGVNRDKVKQIAIDKGLIPADAQLNENEIDNLIFLPGFSTQTNVSAISGRGVGMDVVKRSIHALSGRIFLKSNRGKGSEFTLSLPLTLAVLDGMVVSVDGQTLVAPLSAIVETMSIDREKLRAFGESGAVLADRDGFVPLVDTAAELDFRMRKETEEMVDSVALLVESEGGGRTALIVDEIQDQRQVVIKSLETNYGRVPGVAAATILGDGRVALILDVDALVSRAKGAQTNDSFLAAAG